MPLSTPEDYENLKKDIDSNGDMQYVTHEGQVDGSYTNEDANNEG